MENYRECSKKVKDVSLQELRHRLAEFARVRGWDQYHSPRNLLLALVGEVGELSEIFQWKGEVEKGLPNWSHDDKEHLEEELSDVLLYLVQLADVCGLILAKLLSLKYLKMLRNTLSSTLLPLLRNYYLPEFIILMCA
ncbi:dCTP pyrophosphatase 1 [Sesamum angolense]|uniref:dCTP pyrophosphatase 1 n=1 Tax=Sesamum angolense TaxID=2727404 RepID=A0AAE1WM88_9LAMI|nr:dCTP pyrophosphatase 1 [Sesamum angolense]